MFTDYVVKDVAMTKLCAGCGLPLHNDASPLESRHRMPDECIRLLKTEFLRTKQEWEAIADEYARAITREHDAALEIIQLRARGDTYKFRAQILAERLRLSRTTDRIALEFWENTVDIIGAENDRLRAALIQIRHAMLRVGNGLNWANGETTDLLAASVNIAHKALRD